MNARLVNSRTARCCPLTVRIRTRHQASGGGKRPGGPERSEREPITDRVPVHTVGVPVLTILFVAVGFVWFLPVV